MADKQFAPAGSIEMRLGSGDYSIRAATDDHIRVSFAGNYRNAAADFEYYRHARKSDNPKYPA